MTDDQIYSNILEYEMSPQEAIAYQLACVYLQKSREMFPNYKHGRMAKKDPRKSEIFRHCYKLIRDSAGQLIEAEYDLYIYAQLDVLRHIQGLHPHISPAILSGPKAWKRWLIWKTKYDQIKNFASSPTASVVFGNIDKTDKIKKSLKQTKEYFLVRFDRLHVDYIKNALNSGELFLWITWAKVSPYYLILSPVVSSWLETNKINDRFNIDLDLYKDNVTPEIIEFFKKEFSHEY